MLSFHDFARHPALAGLCDKLANMSALNDNDRLRIVESAADDAGISHLDVEMVQPGARSAVPFAPSRVDAAAAYQDGVAHHVHRLLQGGSA